MKSIWIATLLLFVLFPGWGQVQEISGIIRDQSTQLPISQATVSIDGTPRSVSAGTDGVYMLDRRSSEQNITFSCIGYKSKTISVNEDPNVFLQPISLPLTNLNLFASAFERVDSINNMLVQSSKSFVLKEKFASYPGKWSAFYETITRKIQTQPSYAPSKQNAILNFEVDTSGKITNTSISSDDVSFREIVMESLTGLEAFNPATQNGTPVSQKFTLKIVDDQFMVVDKPAEPEGGYPAFYEYIRNNIEYPQLARKTGVQGKVFIQFMVEEDGSVTDLEAIKTIGAGCDEEGIRLIKEGPRWIPAMQMDKPVAQSIVFPIAFSLRTQQDKITPPTFKGGPEKLADFIRKNRKSMNIPLPINRTGDMVRIEFTVKRSGKITDIGVIQSLGEPFDSEAIRLYSSMPSWNPAKDDGVPFNKTLQTDVSFSTIPDAQKIQAAEHYVKALNLASSKDHSSAVDQFGQAILKNPTNLDYYVKRAESYFFLKQLFLGCRDLKVIKAYDKESQDKYEDLCGNQ